MLELNLDNYYNNLFYRSQDVAYVDLFGNVYRVLEAMKNGVNYQVDLVDVEDNDPPILTFILGGHERLFVDYHMEMIDDL